MATTSRQNSLLVNQDWTRLYESFRNADFQSYDFQTLRKSMVDYLQLYYPEDFNDFVESSEYIALLDLIAFLGQSLAFRTDLNARENFIDTAQRRDSILKLAKLVSYVPKRNQTASGYLKFVSVQTTEPISDSSGIDITNAIIRWNDNTNINWYEQFVSVINASLQSNQYIGKPSNSQTINGVVNDEYQINTPANNLPVYAFQTQVESTSLNFEIVSASSVGKDYIYEVSPQPSAPLNILYKNDNLGNASNNTGFFAYFKQGSLQNVNFGVTESVPNNLVSINYNNINNTDVWLYELSNAGTVRYEWTQVPAVAGVNIIYNNNSAQKSFQVNTRNNDQIDLVFGDGTFAQIPQGSFRTYFRTSAGLAYKITPDEMQNIKLSIPYVSRAGRLETLTIVASLKYTIANSIATESIKDISTRAPQQYYTQNRMVTGEDYNTFPYGYFNSISKIKSVNRSSSGVSRYLDVIDTTGRYSSTNIFADDGVIYKEDATRYFDFTWNTTADILKVIDNQLTPIIENSSMAHFYYENFNRFSLTNMAWNRTTVATGASTGYFVSSTGTPQAIGSDVSGNNSYLTLESIVVFSPGTGNYFNSQNEIVALPASGVLPPNGQPLLYVAVTQLVGTGAQGVLTSGLGPVTLSQNVPSGAIATTVIPSFSNSFSSTFVATLIKLIQSYTEFAIRFDQATNSWAIVSLQNINSTKPFSQANQGSSNGTNSDSSWLLNFTVNDLIYTVTARGLSYVFESANQTKFYFDKQVKIFDSVTGSTIHDFVNVLKVNGDPDTNQPLQENITWFIDNQVAESDGYVDNSKVLITFADSNYNGVPDNPDIFKTIVQPDVDVAKKLVFFQKTYGYDSFITYTLVDNTTVNVEYPNQQSIKNKLANYLDGQLFYATDEQNFYLLSVTNGVYSLSATADYIVKTGRQGLYFQYRHNAPGNRRIDPSPSNLIDMYILTTQYERDYISWVTDTTGAIAEPSVPTSESLRLLYNDLENYKSVSDAIIYNSATFKPLFGSKADSTLQATFKVIKNSNVNVSDSEIRSQVLMYINNYFNTSNWDFGETFYFTELATYIQQAMAPNISSIIIVPNTAGQIYGSMQQISSGPNEILISCATVENIEVITAITAAQLNLQNQLVNTIIN